MDLTPAETASTLEDDVGSEVYRELLAAFLAQLSVQVVELNAAVGARDVPAAQYVAHQIKGTASSFGAARLDELAKRALRMDGHEVELLRTLVSEIEVEVAHLQSVVGI
jgi:HPt (histidine-containing phosphotransfer) domain-containing protein